jgi:hypothetical protein
MVVGPAVSVCLSVFLIMAALMSVKGFVAVAAEATQQAAFDFRDVTAELGLLPHVGGVHGHGAAWGDADGDGLLDLYVATFADKPAGRRNMLFRQNDGRFIADDQPVLAPAMRGNTPVFADLDNDGDLDLYVASMPKPAAGVIGCRLFRNDGGGRFVDVSRESGCCPEEFGGRGCAVLDIDGDALLDLLVGEDPLVGYNGSQTRSSRLFRNRGGLTFVDVSREAGLPESVPGLGSCVADWNGDSLPDFFLAAQEGGCRMFLNHGGGRFRESAELSRTFAWPAARGDDMVAGAAAGDVDLDGRLDLLVGPHFEQPWKQPVAPRLFLNRGTASGLRFEEPAIGLTPLALKCPHVEIQDFDNDGLADALVSIVKFAGGRSFPIIYRGTGMRDGVPCFSLEGWSVNDFPAADDLQGKGTKGFFETMLANRKITYAAAGPTADFNGDGKLDVFFASWWPEQPSLLLRNDTRGGHWLDVRVVGDGKRVNRQGIGARVRVYAAGRLGEQAGLVGHREIAVGQGYVSGQPAVAHFGLGGRREVDVDVSLPHGRGRIERKNVPVDRVLVLDVREAVPAATGTANGGTAWQEPKLPDDKPLLGVSTDRFLKPPIELTAGVGVATKAPVVDVFVYPGQTYEGRPWSNWGHGSFVGGRSYSAIGDHRSPAGTARVFEYEPRQRTLRRIVDTETLYRRPVGEYSPAKIHGRLDAAADGRIFFATHRGSAGTTTDAHGYRGDDILAFDPRTGATEVVASAPVAKHSIPTSLVDPERMIFYGGTAAGKNSPVQVVQFLAYDLRARRVLQISPDGPPRSMIWSRSTGRVYFVPESSKTGQLVRFDPAAAGPPQPIAAHVGLRAASLETPQGVVYAIGSGQAGKDPEVYAFDVRTEQAERLGTAAVGGETYIASLDVDPAGRYLYYVPGAHGSADRDGTPVVQFDTRARTKKVIAFLAPYFRETAGFWPAGTYSTVLDEDGSSLYITFNTNRGTKVWDFCTLFVVHIPESERRP